MTAGATVVSALVLTTISRMHAHSSLWLLVSVVVLIVAGAQASCSHCAASETCCTFITGAVGCCAVADAQCCDDGLTCCPAGYTCDTMAKRCRAEANGAEIPVLPVTLKVRARHIALVP